MPTSLSEPDAFPLGVRSFITWSQVKILRMLGEEVTSLSDSPAAEGLVRSHDSSSAFDPVRADRSGVGFFFFFRKLYLGD